MIVIMAHPISEVLFCRSMSRRDRYPEHCRQHLHILDLLDQDRNAEASAFMREHLEHTLRSLAKIEHILQPHGGGQP